MREIDSWLLEELEDVGYEITNIDGNRVRPLELTEYIAFPK